MATSSGDWTAGIIAIFAALLIGSGIPTAVYFGLYKPKQAERERAERDLAALREDEGRVMREQQEVNRLKGEMEAMATRLDELGAAFEPPTEGSLDVPEVRRRIAALAEEHGLRLQPRRAAQIGAQIVYFGDQEVRFEHGLRATLLTIEAEATYHDFGRFLADLESNPDLVLLPESLLCQGDNNGGRLHSFVMHVYVVLKRDVAQVGR